MATKPKPKGWNAMSKAKQDAWKKANFNSSVKVTEAQLNKLRAEKTPDRAIAKYKNDPAMREALNRFYGKSRVSSAGGSSGSGSGSGGENSGPNRSSDNRYRGGPGAKPRVPRPSTTMPKTSGPSWDALKNSTEFKNWSKGAAAGIATVGIGKGALIARNSYKAGAKAVSLAKRDYVADKKAFDKGFKKAMDKGYKGVGIPKGPPLVLTPRKTALGRAKLANAVAAAEKKAAAKKGAPTLSKTTVGAKVASAKSGITKVATTAGKTKAGRVAIKVGKSKVGKVAGKLVSSKVAVGLTAASLAKAGYDKVTEDKKKK